MKMFKTATVAFFLAAAMSSQAATSVNISSNNVLIDEVSVKDVVSRPVLAKDPLIANIIENDDYVMMLQTRMAEIQQKPYVGAMLERFMPHLINPVANKSYQLIEFFDFNCHYCREAVGLLSDVLGRNGDTTLSYIVLLPENSPITMQYAAYGLSKVSIPKQAAYLTAMFDLLDRNTVTLDDVKAELSKYGIEPKEEELNTFVSEQTKLTNDAYVNMHLQGTPMFVLIKRDQSKAFEVMLGTEPLKYLDSYILKLKNNGVKQ